MGALQFRQFRIQETFPEEKKRAGGRPLHSSASSNDGRHRNPKDIADTNALRFPFLDKHDLRGCFN
jgi:hypothetical protein